MVVYEHSRRSGRRLAFVDCRRQRVRLEFADPAFIVQIGHYASDDELAGDHIERAYAANAAGWREHYLVADLCRQRCSANRSWWRGGLSLRRRDQRRIHIDGADGD